MTDTLTAGVISFLMILNPHPKDGETQVQRKSRAETYALASSDAADELMCEGKYKTDSCEKIWKGTKKHLMALGVAQMIFESAFAKHIQEGRCGENECDAMRWNGKIIHRARSLFQLQRSGKIKPYWDKLTGIEFEPTRNSAFFGMRILANGYYRCNNNDGAFAASAGIPGCKWSQIAARQKFFTRVINSL